MGGMFRGSHLCSPGGITPSTGSSGSNGPLPIDLLIRSHTQARFALANVIWPPLFPVVRTLQWAHASATGAIRRTSRSLSGCLSTRGDFAAYTYCILNCVAKFPLFCGELHCRNSEARVSRMTGKFDTTATDRKRQVALSVLPLQAAGTQVACRQKRPNAKAPLPRGVAPRL